LSYISVNKKVVQVKPIPLFGIFRKVLKAHGFSSDEDGKMVVKWFQQDFMECFVE
jgi:hypothetical protein